MQIGLECFMDEQLSSMIASEARYGDCEIQQKTNCIIYDTEEDHYLEEYLEEIMDAFTVAKHLRVDESDIRADYIKNFLARWNVFSVDESLVFGCHPCFVSFKICHIKQFPFGKKSS